ncbi:DNA cytosine methyltransferase [Rhizobiaceae bacterium BDR2-2]|uniref:Cytosine-specific methyltransferase n=1 Tax=Ectorhizobium quercum TaxID=2965071 RepID=A0AAE3N547_9HYPH|nr:DNA cytosine methyltransferase [Ectorhizobium quercum]MCX8996244.1 DNA cytosine methyltransferase [Ectorhizobium quercum]MCX8998717.1 DNA cytosine methyltransferase [Ectorhizobium quercum]
MRVVELFSGAGGISLGLRRAGFDILKAYDAWPVAVENYNRNVGNHAVVADLKDLLSTIPEILGLAPDMIAGGPPCQDYSSAGNRTEADNARLTLAFALIVATVRPRWFMMENVIGCAKSSTWAEARAILKRAGYGITESRINASRYGVPQSRRRLFVIGRIGERDDFLASSIAATASAQPMTLRDLFGAITPAAIYFPATSEARRSIWGPDEPAPTIRERSIRPIPTSYQPHPDDAALIRNGYVYSRPVRAGRGVRSIDEPFPTVTRTAWERPTPRYLSAPHPGDPVAAVDTAVLTVHQISRIQGFPVSWEWRASAKQDILQMIANAVPAPVATALGRVILDREAGRTAPDISGGFLQWLHKRGKSKASARNVKASAGRARRLLGGRTFNNLALEISALESLPEFQAMRKATQSDLRQALRLLAEYQAKGKQRRQKPRQATAQPIEGFAEAA